MSIDADHSWICAGGQEHGQCAFIRIAGDTPRRTREQRAEVDDILPLNLDPDSRALLSPSFGRPETPTNHSQKYTMHYYELGALVVNSVKIHAMQSPKEGLEDDIVVIATYVGT